MSVFGGTQGKKQPMECFLLEMEQNLDIVDAMFESMQKVLEDD